MDCSNCGAPVQELAGFCTYCGAANKADENTITVVKISDRNCPRCNNIKLDTISVPSEIPLYIERCRECNGLFFDPLELDDLISLTIKEDQKIDSKELKALEVILAKEGRGEPGNVKYAKCPVCSNFMNRKTYEANFDVIVDSCKHGIWLDGGELNKVLRWIKLGGKKPQISGLQGNEPVKTYYPPLKLQDSRTILEIILTVAKIIKKLVD